MIKTYRVKDNASFGPGGMYKAGAEIQLEESEATPFLDKIELVTPAESIPPAIPPLKNELGAKIPDELKLIPDDDAPGIRIEPLEDIQVPAEKKKPGRKKKA
jgi:hypothetical protein